MYCPVDMEYCIDDLCGVSCIMTGELVYRHCYGCGNLISDEDHEDCECDPEISGDEEE